MAFNIANLGFYGVGPLSGGVGDHSPDDRLLYRWRYGNTGQTLSSNKSDLQATGLADLYERVHDGDVLKIVASDGVETYAVRHDDNAGNPRLALAVFGEFGIPS